MIAIVIVTTTKNFLFDFHHHVQKIIIFTPPNFIKKFCEKFELMPMPIYCSGKKKVNHNERMTEINDPFGT